MDRLTEFFETTWVYLPGMLWAGWLAFQITVLAILLIAAPSDIEKQPRTSTGSPFKKHALIFALSYVAYSLTIHSFNKKEIFPLFHWALFTRIPEEDIKDFSCEYKVKGTWRDWAYTSVFSLS